MKSVKRARGLSPRCWPVRSREWGRPSTSWLESEFKLFDEVLERRLRLVS